MFLSNIFPNYVEPSLLEGDVINYLIDAKSQGLEVYKCNEGFMIDLGNDKLIRIEDNGNGQFSINANHKRGIFLTIGVAKKISELEKFIKLAGSHHQVDLGTYKPVSIRTSSDKPASNKSKISNLIGTSIIQAVYDTYLDNKGLQNLTDILSLCAGSIAADVRLLSKIHGANLTKTFVDDWFKEHGCINGEIRILPKEEHRRFLLLSSSESLILGLSLNSINKNEAASLESDKDDRKFFNDMWKKSNKFI